MAQGFAANLGLLWTELTLSDRIRAAARAGFRAVEFHWPYDTDPGSLGLLAQDLGLELLGINTAPGDLAAGEIGLAAVPGAKDRFRDHFDQALAYCEAAGTSAIHIMTGAVADADWNTARDTFLDNLAWAGRQAEGSGVRLLIEPLNSGDNPGYFLVDLAQAIAILDDLGDPMVRLQFDSYHIARQGYPVEELLVAVKQHVGHVQIAASPDRGAPDHGDVDHAAFLHRLRAIGYSGWVATEYRTGPCTEDSLGWLAPFQAIIDESTLS